MELMEVGQVKRVFKVNFAEDIRKIKQKLESIMCRATILDVCANQLCRDVWNVKKMADYHAQSELLLNRLKIYVSQLKGITL